MNSKPTTREVATHLAHVVFKNRGSPVQLNLREDQLARLLTVASNLSLALGAKGPQVTPPATLTDEESAELAERLEARAREGSLLRPEPTTDTDDVKF